MEERRNHRVYDMSGFSYDITDVVHLLQLRVRHKNSSSMDVNCPFCGETKGKMNVNLQKNVFRCNRCDASGGMLELYGRLHGVSSAEANRQIREALGKGEYRTDYQVVHKEEPVEIFNAELADADVIDRTYQEMLSLLTLNDKHQEDLKKRGLTKEQIEIQRYRSVPLFGIKNMVQKLLESGQTVKGVPGFYEDQDGKWTVNFTSKNSGILIPIRSMEGKIQGFQIRLDQVMEGRKYIWLSSVKFQNGVSSGSPVHVIGSLDAEQIYLTEGALKGTIAERFDIGALEILIKQYHLENIYLTNQFNILHYLDRAFHELSGGEMQRIQLLPVLLKNTDIMILDEPTSDLDMKTKEILSEILWELGRERIIFIVTHERNLFERFSDIKTIYLK